MCDTHSQELFNISKILEFPFSHKESFLLGDTPLHSDAPKLFALPPESILILPLALHYLEDTPLRSSAP